MAGHRALIDLLLDQFSIAGQADEHAFTFLDVDGRFVEWSAGAEKIYEPKRTIPKNAPARGSVSVWPW